MAAAEASAAPAVPRLPLTARGMGARSPIYLVSHLMKPSAEPVPLSFLITAKQMRWKRCAWAADTPILRMVTAAFFEHWHKSRLSTYLAPLIHRQHTLRVLMSFATRM